MVTAVPNCSSIEYVNPSGKRTFWNRILCSNMCSLEISQIIPVQMALGDSDLIRLGVRSRLSANVRKRRRLAKEIRKSHSRDALKWLCSDRCPAIVLCGLAVSGQSIGSYRRWGIVHFRKK